jgi:hypothetical protein
MGIGAGVFLMAVGAILTFAVDFTVSGLDIAVVGVVLMAAGAVGIVLDLAVFAPRRRRVVYQDRPRADGYVEEYDAPEVAPTRVRRRTTTEYPDNRPSR